MPSPTAGSAVPTRTGSAVFRRDLHRPLKTIVRAEGMTLFDQDGRRYLDAVGGAGGLACAGIRLPRGQR